MWEEMFDNEDSSLFELQFKGVTFFLARGCFKVPEGMWGIGTSYCCGNTLLGTIQGNTEEAKVLGKRAIKRYLSDLLVEID